MTVETRAHVYPASGTTAAPRHARIAVLGASGYSGQEFARLALGHPGVTRLQLVSRELAGQPAERLLVGFAERVAGGTGGVATGGAAARAELPAIAGLDAARAAVAAGDVDTVVSCLPHGAWRELAPGFEAAAGGRAEFRVVDLSGDHRASDHGAGDHRDAAADYVYGLPEAFRAAIPTASRVANPGCYPTAAALALLPALELGWIAGPVTISAVSGVSGAGRAAALRTSFVERDGGAELYKAGTVHQHVAEMCMHLGRIAGSAIDVGFAPQIVPMARGILLVANAPLAIQCTPEQAHAAFASRYTGEPFVRVLPAGSWPETRAVAHSNRCDVAVTTMHEGRHLLVSAAIDNLVKGAAGQALQNLNLMLGWPEMTALPVDGVPW